jgi:hypothetical protein
VRIGPFRDGGAHAARPELPPDPSASWPADGGVGSDSLTGSKRADGEPCSPVSGPADAVCRLAA